MPGFADYGGIAGQLGGVLSGFNSASDQIRQENQRQGEQDRQREQSALSILANSPDATPEIRAHAVTGMLASGNASGGGGSSSTGLDKFFGKTAKHPLFPIVNQLVGGMGAEEPGQPRMFMDPSERIAQETAAKYGGEFTGTVNAMIKAGYSPDDAKKEALRRFHGAAGTPKAMQSLTGKYEDENGDVKTMGLTFDPNTGRRFWDDGEDASTRTPLAISRTGSFTEPNALRGAMINTEPDKNSATGYSKVHYTASGKEIGRALNAPEPNQGPPKFDPGGVMTPEGLVRFPRNSTVGVPATAPGGGPVVPAVAPGASLASLEKQVKQIEEEATYMRGGKDVALPLSDPRVKPRADAAAVRAGFTNYQDALAQRNAARQREAVAVPPAPGPAGAKKPAAGAAGAGAAGASGGIDSQKVLDYLKKYSGG